MVDEGGTAAVASPAPTTAADGPVPARRRSARAAATREALLDSARIVFSQSGYVEASIADVVAGSQASVGSLYHHFGGKADLYLALFESFSEEQVRRATAAVVAARATGETDPMRQFLAGTAAYLDSCWDQRDLALLFLDSGGPDGFEQVRRRTRDWIRANTALLQADERSNGEALVHTLTTVAGTAGREVALSADAAVARRTAEDYLDLLSRLATPPKG